MPVRAALEPAPPAAGAEAPMPPTPPMPVAPLAAALLGSPVLAFDPALLIGSLPQAPATVSNTATIGPTALLMCELTISSSSGADSATTTLSI